MDELSHSLPVVRVGATISTLTHRRFVGVLQLDDLVIIVTEQLLWEWLNFNLTIHISFMDLPEREHPAFCLSKSCDVSTQSVGRQALS